MSETRIVVADDHPLFRRGLVEAIKHQRGFVIAGEADNAASAWELIERLEPDVAVLDIEMGAEQTIPLARRAREQGLSVRLLFLTMHKEETTRSPRRFA
jgi:two-component system nitrate/nitrite response regulator NarL